jgi:hypothetical protein
MKRISAGGAGGVGVRERGAAVALAALPRLQLELTAFTRHTGLQRQEDPLVKSPPWCQSLLVESSFGMRSPVFTQLGPLADTSTRLAEARFETKAEIEPPA